MAGIDTLYDFETAADRQIAQLDIWKLPLRTLLTALYLSADSLFVGERFSRGGARKPEHGTAIFRRMSYMTQHLAKCSDNIGAHVDDALEILSATDGQQIKEMLQYGHFCELMPEARRGLYSSLETARGFSLQHTNESVARFEERDIIFTDLSLPFDKHSFPQDYSAFDRMILSWPTLNPADLFPVLFRMRDYYLSVFQEAPLLPEAAYVAGFGFTRESFQSVRSALLAFADFCLGMAAAAERQWIATGDVLHRWGRECREWSAPLLSRNFVSGLVTQLASETPDTVDRVVSFFSMELKGSKFGNAGDGFWPPLMLIGESCLFSPYALKLMMPERNLLYVLNRTKRGAFDKYVSGHLEPMLLTESSDILSKIDGLCIAKNVEWAKGEIDLLIFQPSSNTVIQVQAKAALPPEGSRMTRQVEEQTIKAIEQLEKLLAEPVEVRNRICAKEFGKDAAPETWISVVLSRSGIGSHRAMAALKEGIVTVNPPLLRGIVRDARRNSDFALNDLATMTNELIDAILARTVKGWHTEKITVFGKEIKFPLLDLDHDQIWEIRKELYAE